MMIHVVIVRILHPDPEWLRRLAMTLVIPSKVRSNGQSDPEDSSGDGLGVGINLHQRISSAALLILWPALTW